MPLQPMDGYRLLHRRPRFVGVGSRITESFIYSFEFESNHRGFAAIQCAGVPAACATVVNGGPRDLTVRPGFSLSGNEKSMCLIY